MVAPQGKILVRQDELAEFLAGMDKYSANKGSDRGAYLRAYNGGTLHDRQDWPRLLLGK